MIRKLFVPLAAVFGLLFVVSAALWLLGGEKPGKLSWDIKTKKTVMTFAYKAYGNPAAAEGRWYLSKTVFKNEGQGPVRNVQISYNIPNWVSWTTPEKFPEILPGQTVIHCYYPQLPDRVTELTSPKTSTLEVKITWDEDGQPKEEIIKKNFDLRGVNEIEYTSLPANEIVTWYDMFENTDLVAAMVTTDDPVVKTFAAEVTKFAGGTTAGAGGGNQEVLRLMKAFYNYQVATDIHYASAKGVPEKLGDVRTLIQNVRLPREVIMNGNGLCIELAILWSAVMEHLGLKTYLCVIPGHAFTIVVSDNGEWFPIECTGVGGAGIGGSMDFESAVQAAAKTLQEAQVRKLIDVQKLQKEGIRPPELQRIDPKTVQDILAKRAQPRQQPDTPPDRTPQQPEVTPAELGAEFKIFTHPNGLFTFGYPKNWQTDMQSVRNLQQLAPWYIYLAGDPAAGTSVEAYHFKDTSNIEATLDQISNLIETAGGSFELETGVEVKVGGYQGYRCSGTIKSGTGQQPWIALLVSTKSGVVGLGTSCNSMTYNQHKGVLEKILQSFKPK